MDFPGYKPGERRPLMRPEGSGTSRLLVVGEALGESEENDRLPFRPYAEAGSVLERALFRAGLPRDALTLANLVWYRPPQNWLDGAPWEMASILACRPLLDALVAERQPRCILALGGLAWRELSGFAGEARRYGITSCRGWIVPGFQYAGIPVVGTYHPSFLRRGSKEVQRGGPRVKTDSAGGGTQGMALLGALIRDLKLAASVARTGPPALLPTRYKLGATLDDWASLQAEAESNPDLLISYDFEARELGADEEEFEAGDWAPTQFQVSIRPGEALVSEWTSDMTRVAKRLLELPNPKLDWNGRKFDRGLLRKLGIRVDQGVWHDGMDLWHHAQPDLPRGLQYASSFFSPEAGPWKHLFAADPLYYGARDVDDPQRIFQALRTSLGMTRSQASAVSLWEGYDSQVARVAPVFDRMTDRGIPVSDAKREALGSQFDKTLVEMAGKLDELVPDEVKNVEPKEGYKRKTRGLPQACLEASGQARLFAPEGLGGVEEEGSRPAVGGAAGEAGILGCPGEVSGGPNSTMDAAPGEGSRTGGLWDGATIDGRASRVITEDGRVFVQREFKARGPLSETAAVRWARLLPFLPGSSEQVKRYIRARGWEVPRDLKDPDKESTAELGLQKLIKQTRDPALRLILDYREVAKAKSTYVEGWKPDEAGRVHPFWGFKPATAQTSSEAPNAQNFPKHSELAGAMREMIEARLGFKLVSFDWKSFHVLTTGFEAKCPLLMRMARLDMHTFFAVSGLLRLESADKLIALPDDELGAKLAWYRKRPEIYPAYACAGHPAGMTLAQIRDEQAKPTGLGIGFGQTPGGMFKRNPDSFANLAGTKLAHAAYFGVFPEVRKWHRSVRLEADYHKKLVTRYGYQRWFWDVFSRRPLAQNYQARGDEVVLEGRDGRAWRLGPGDDHEACVAYRPANDAFGIKRDCLRELGEAQLDAKWGLILDIHDDLTFECPSSELDEMIPYVKGMMERPSPRLVDPDLAPVGLSCAVEVSLGPSLGRMEKLKF